MTITNMKKWAAVAVCAVIAPLAAQATGVIALGGGALRSASLGSAEAGYTGSGNGTAAAVTVDTGGAAWTEVGNVAGSGGPGTYNGGGLRVVVTTGSWGGQGPLTGTWTILNSATFWATYGDAAISMHVGGGQGAPEHFTWVLTDNATTGTWTYDGSTAAGNGGGLSNLKLFGRTGTRTDPNPPTVPEGGTTVVLLGIALCGLGMARSRMVKA